MTVISVQTAGKLSMSCHFLVIPVTAAAAASVAVWHKNKKTLFHLGPRSTKVTYIKFNTGASAKTRAQFKNQQSLLRNCYTGLFFLLRNSKCQSDCLENFRV